MISLVGQNVGNFRVTAKIGEGGMGSVYLGEHPLIGKKVAIKVLHEDLAQKEDIVARFFTEAKAVNDIGHPNIVDIVDFGKLQIGDKDIVYFIMEFLDGEGLNTRLKREGVTIEDALWIVSQCCSALAASHQKSIVHRDIKPENIYLISRPPDQNYVKLLDFGIAKLTGAQNSSQNMTRTGLVIGTPSYMSPEQCEGKGNIDWRSDIYSLGVCLFEMLTGRTPFSGEGFGEILIAHMTRPPPLPSTLRPDLPPAIEAVVLHALEKNRDVRFQTMEEFAQALADPEAHFATYEPQASVTDEDAGEIDVGAAGPLATGRVQPTPTSQVTSFAPRATRSSPGAGQSRPPTDEGQVVGPRTLGDAEGLLAPRPTTLSGATGEMTAQGTPVSSAPPRRGRSLLIGGLAAVAASVALIVYMSGSRPTTTSTPKVLVMDSPVQEEQTIRVTVDSNPPGAKVFRSGFRDPVGTTPFMMTAKKGEPNFDLSARLEGYRPQGRTVATERDYDLRFELEKERPAPVASTSSPTRPTRSSSRRSAQNSTPSSETELWAIPESEWGGKKKASPPPPTPAPHNKILIKPKFD